MRKRLFFIPLFLICIAVIAGNYETVKLKGKLTGGKSSTQQVEVLKSESELLVNFLDCIGNLVVEVVDENGMTVFNQTVDTCITNTISINIKGWDAGNYIIRISDMGSGWLEGGFVIK